MTSIVYTVYIFFILCKSMSTVSCSAANSPQEIFFCAQQKKVSHKGLQHLTWGWVNNDRISIFWLNHPFKRDICRIFFLLLLRLQKSMSQKEEEECFFLLLVQSCCYFVVLSPGFWYFLLLHCPCLALTNCSFSLLAPSCGFVEYSHADYMSSLHLKMRFQIVL